MSTIKDEVSFTSPDGGIVKMTLDNFKETDVAKLKLEMAEAGWEYISHRVVIKPNPRINWIFFGVILGIVVQTVVASIAVSW